MKQAPLIAAILLIGASSCFGEKTIKGNKNIVTRAIPVEQFHAVELGSQINDCKNAEFFYTQETESGEASMEITMDENLFDELKISQKNGRLCIGTKNAPILKPSSLTIKASSATMKEIEINGVTNFTAEKPLQTDEIDVEINGVGNVKLNALTCQKIEGEVSGVGSLYVTGQAEKSDFEVNGVGHIYAFDCPTKDAECEVNGVGSIEVHATDRLEAETNGIGSITYKGTPTTKQISRTGIGKIKQAD